MILPRLEGVDRRVAIPAAEAPEMIPADEPSMEARTLEEAQPIPDIELVEHGVDEREVGHLAAES